MIYVEWLRVRMVLKCTAIVMAVLLALAGIGRLAVWRYFAVHSQNAYSPNPMHVGDLAVTGLVFAMIVATILGAPFAKENDGHLEIAMTKPVGRIALALQTMLLDAGGIVATFVLGTLFITLVHMLFEPVWFQMTTQDALALVLGVVGPIAWYAMLNAITASMKRGYGMGLGFAWPVAGAVIVLAKYLRNDGIGAVLRPVFVALSYIDPFKYMNASTLSSFELLMLVVLALVYGALATLQWQRVEA